MTDRSERAGDAENPYRSPKAPHDHVSEQQRRTHPVVALLTVVMALALLWPAIPDLAWTAIRNFDVATYFASAGVIVVLFAAVVGVAWWRRRP